MISAQQETQHKIVLDFSKGDALTIRKATNFIKQANAQLEICFLWARLDFIMKEKTAVSTQVNSLPEKHNVTFVASEVSMREEELIKANWFKLR